MSGRGEPAGCHGDALKGGLCARLSCAAPARIPGPRPASSARGRPVGPVLFGSFCRAQHGAGSRGCPGSDAPASGTGILPGAGGASAGRVGYLGCKDAPGAARREAAGMSIPGSRAGKRSPWLSLFGIAWGMMLVIGLPE